ncbi:MAG: FkbM family methyltransferase [Candidatus Thermoplasmatota archaeon]|nr:FkbM family methyltransferase [Candidatus Thermoplasmatota archaeon]
MELRTLLRIRKAYRNWVSVLYQLYRVRNEQNKTKKTVKIILKNNYQLLQIPYPLALAYMDFISTPNPHVFDVNIENENLVSFLYDNHRVKLDVGNGSGPYEIFNKHIYDFLKVEGQTVIDIGGNIGDSAIYFAIKGAKKVIVFEPYPHTFNLCKKNITISAFKDKIDVINAGYGKDTIVNIDETFIPDTSTQLKEDGQGRKVNIYSLRTLISKYDVFTGILKMDCEGCEYYLIDEDSEIIKKFKMIQIEYHYGYEKLVNKLVESGFKVHYTLPKKIFNKMATNPYMLVGDIYAEII